MMSGAPGGGSWSGRFAGRDRTGVAIIAAVVALVVYEVARSHRISRAELIFFAVLIPSIILHEVSHGAVALLFGDDTAQRAGRLTLNPLRHVDPVGTIILPAILVLSVGTAFGYAKPVPVNVRRLRNPRNDSLYVSLVGPAVNIALAGISLAAIHWLAPAGTALRVVYVTPFGVPAGWQVVYLLGLANVLLAAFNLIPLPPLDGSAVVERLLPRSWWPGWLRLRAYAMPALILIVLLLPGVRNNLFGHVFDWWNSLVL